MQSDLEELAYLYEMLTPEERDELLQELLVALAVKPESVRAVLDAELLKLSVTETIREMTTEQRGDGS